MHPAHRRLIQSPSFIHKAIKEDQERMTPYSTVVMRFPEYSLIIPDNYFIVSQFLVISNKASRHYHFFSSHSAMLISSHLFSVVASIFIVVAVIFICHRDPARISSFSFSPVDLLCSYSSIVIGYFGPAIVDECSATPHEAVSVHRRNIGVLQVKPVAQHSLESSARPRQDGSVPRIALSV